MQLVRWQYYAQHTNIKKRQVCKMQMNEEYIHIYSPSPVKFKLILSQKVAYHPHLVIAIMVYSDAMLVESRILLFSA